MKSIKKILYISSLIITCLVTFKTNFIFAASDDPDPDPEPGTSTVRYDDGNEGFGINTKKKVGGIHTKGTTNVDTDNGSKILDTVKATINWILGMLSFIALILCIWGGFQMLTAAGDDSKVKTGTKVLKHAAIGLAIIGLAWLIVSFVFRIMNKVTG